MKNEELFELILEDVEFSKEWLETVEGDEIECISIENLTGILKRRILNIKN